MCSHKWNSDYSSLLSYYNIPLFSSRCTVSKLCLLYKILNKILYFPPAIFILKPSPTHSSLWLSHAFYTLFSYICFFTFLCSICFLTMECSSISCQILLISRLFQKSIHYVIFYLDILKISYLLLDVFLSLKK